MSVAEVANLLLSGTALAIAFLALRIARKQVVLDERSLRLAERESYLADQERAARSALIVETRWHPEDGVSRLTSMNAPFSVTVTIRNDGARDATDVTVALLAPEYAHSAKLDHGHLLTQAEQRTVDGTEVRLRRYERVLERVRSVPQEVTGSVELWHDKGPPLAPVVIEVSCADQPPGKETQSCERTLRWVPGEGQ